MNFCLPQYNCLARPTFLNIFNLEAIGKKTFGKAKNAKEYYLQDVKECQGRLKNVKTRKTRTTEQALG